MSDLVTIRTLLKDQLNLDELSLSSDPSSTLLNTYINRALVRIATIDRPVELMSYTPSLANIVINQNYVVQPTTILAVDEVYFLDSNGHWKELKYMDYKSMVQMVGVNRFMDTSDLGDPYYYTVRGGKIVFDRHFARTATGAIGVTGIVAPTVLVNDADLCELPSSWDYLITYEASAMFYIRDDDAANLDKFRNLSRMERSELKLALSMDSGAQVQLNPLYHTSNLSNRNPGVFFE